MAFSKVAMVTALAASAVSSNVNALQVVAPSEGMAIVANQPYTVEWTGASDDDIFEIDLYYCGSYSFCFDEEDGCGFFIADLCGEGGTECVQEESTAEVVFPEPVASYSGDGYRFDYDNGFGSRVGRFRIDLYASGGSGDCGTFITSICDKPDKGCHDTQGDYNVFIPASTPVGFYVIRVGVFGDNTVYGCSESFEVVEPGEELWNL